MGGKRFDSVTRGLITGTSRRRMLGGILAGIFILQTGPAALAAKRGKRRSRGDGSPSAATPLAPGTLAGGVFENSIEICHYDIETGGYTILPVSPISIPDYLNQGDNLFIDCCVDAECGALPCFSASGCIEGACAYNPTIGAACALQDGTTGSCYEDGVCIAGYVPPVYVETPVYEAPAPIG